MTLTPRPFLLAGVATHGEPYTIHCPYDQRPVSSVCRASATHLAQAVVAADRAFAQTRVLPAHRRASILRTVAAQIQVHAETFAQMIALEAGKPIKQARGEVQRAVTTFQTAADECSQSHDEILRLDRAPGGEGRHAMTRRFPIGPIAAISPFNFPLNLVAHKVAPALAAGCHLAGAPVPGL